MAQSKKDGSSKAVDKKQQPAAKKAGTAKAAAKKTTNKAPTAKKAVTKKTASGASLTLPADYRPGPDEAFMNPVQLEYFRQKLLRWRAELLFEANQTLTNLSSESLHRPDQMDRAQIESNAALDLRTRDRERKLLQKIEAALRRIEDGSYGYCEETGDPISIARLEARPIASLSLHAQEQHERMERVHRDD